MNKLFGEDESVLLYLRRVKSPCNHLINIMNTIPNLFDMLDLRSKTLWCLSSRFALESIWDHQVTKLRAEWMRLPEDSYTVDKFIEELITRHGFYYNLHAAIVSMSTVCPFYRNINYTLFRSPHGKRVHTGDCTEKCKSDSIDVGGYSLYFPCKKCKSKCFIVNCGSKYVITRKMEAYNVYKQLITLSKMWQGLWNVAFPNKRKLRSKLIYIPDDTWGIPLCETSYCEKCEERILRRCEKQSVRVKTKFGRIAVLCPNCYKQLTSSSKIPIPTRPCREFFEQG